MFSRSPNDFLNFSAQPDATPATYDEVRQRLIWSQEILFPAIRDAHSSHAAAAIASYARRHRILKSDPFPPGSVVMVRDPVRQNKMQPTYTGPFKVIRRTKGGSYELSDLQGAPAACAVAPSMMKPVIVDPALDADSYVVETILAHRDTPSQRLYHVRWKGFGPEQIPGSPRPLSMQPPRSTTIGASRPHQRPLRLPLHLPRPAHPLVVLWGEAMP